MAYKIVDCDGKEHNVHTGHPLQDVRKCESGVVLMVQVEDSIEIWEIYDSHPETIRGVIDVAYADTGIDILGYAVAHIVSKS